MRGRSFKDEMFARVIESRMSSQKFSSKLGQKSVSCEQIPTAEVSNSRQCTAKEFIIGRSAEARSDTFKASCCAHWLAMQMVFLCVFHAIKCSSNGLKTYLASFGASRTVEAIFFLWFSKYMLKSSLVMRFWSELSSSILASDLCWEVLYTSPRPARNL